MLTKLLNSSLLCLLIVFGAQAQQLKVVAETESFTDYEFHNPDQKILSPHGITIPVRGNAARYQILEQKVSTVPETISETRAAVMNLSDASQPLLDISKPGIYRGKKVSTARLNITRTGENSSLVLTSLKLRVYKQGDKVHPSNVLAKSAATGLFENGTWYKIPISTDGIYQIDAEYLEQLGIDLESINPKRIQIWGTGGYQLPEANNQPRPEFTEIPIIVRGEDNEAFNGDDRILFYANSPHKVERNGSNYTHQLHPYSNQNYVFLTIANENGKRMSPANSDLQNYSRTITTFNDFIWKDEELYKAEERLKSGRYWLGQRFPASSNGSLINVLRDTLPGIIPNQSITINGQFVNRSTSNSTFDIQINGVHAQTVSIPRISSYNSSEGASGEDRAFTTTVNAATGDIIEVDARYNHNESNSTGFLDWLRITVERQLEAKNGRLFFYSPSNGSPSESVQYQLSGFGSEPLVMEVSDVTSPKLLSVSASESTYNLNYYSGYDLPIIAQTNFLTPQQGERIEPQNLRSISGYPDYIIVTSQNFLEYANELANYRQQQDGFSSVIATQGKIFNDFSGGVKDPSAIRDYVKFLYDRALQNGQEPPRYLLLFGDTTFDYKGIIEDSYTNHVLTYQSPESLHRTNTFPTDDFFGFLDDDEGALGSGYTSYTALLDIGLGRIPAQTQSEAAIAIQKIKSYENPNNTGNWQSLFTFAADDDFPDVGLNRDKHVYNANETANRINIAEPGIRLKKIYEFDYPVEITGSGRRIPGATEEFINALNSGTLIMNYSGHGNERTLSDEQLFTTDFIPQLTNADRLAVLVTATCQFGRYDDIDAQSGAEQLFFAENGGIVAAYTTTRVVYTGSNISAGNNFGLNVALSQRILERNLDGSAQRLGDIYTQTKNTPINNTPVVSSLNSKKFILLGDPAGKFRLPEQKANLTSINDYTENLQDTTDTTVTIRALDKVILNGQITDVDGSLMTNYSGETTITVLDAPRTVNLPNDREWVQAGNCELSNCNYEVENDVIFRGKAAVNNGKFSSTFIVPKDISFSDSSGRIVFFANSEGKTAGGSFTKVKFNGLNEEAEANDDGRGPQMDVYLNDERFVNGSLVGSSPNLIIQLEDSSGINTTGTGVGHEIIATIDTKPQQSFVLNDFYEGNLNDYTRGRIEYPLDQLPEGSYTLKVRAWDVHNNPSEEEVFFEVASSEELSVRNVYNFPNPMNNATRFTFEHNQPGNPLDVSIRIYTPSGKPVQQIQESLITTSSYASISWDGRDRDYDRLGNGTYIYVLRVATDTPKGRQTTEQIEKLVIIR